MGEILGFLYKKIQQLNWQPLAPPIEGLYVEVKLKNQNWLIGCSYNLDKYMISQHLEAVVKNMVLHSSTYENFNFLGDFNAGMKHSALTHYFNLHCPLLA